MLCEDIKRQTTREILKQLLLKYCRVIIMSVLLLWIQMSEFKRKTN